MSVFECVHLRGNLFRRIGRQDGAFCLKDNRSFVVMFVYVMDRNTGLPLAGGNDRLVHVYPVHAFASVFRQKCRMNIDNLTRIAFNKGSEILFMKPARTIRSVSYSASFAKTGAPSANSSLEKTKEGTPNLFTRACTPTFRLLDKTTATLIVSLLEKYRTIFSAFVPDPEAKIATFFMFSPFFVHKKRKNVQFSAFLAY